MNERDALATSEALHQRVRSFARSALAAVSGVAAQTPGGGASPESFELLALDIARFQAEHNPALARLWRHHGAHLGALVDVPAVPADAFRLGRVATFPAALDAAAFQTSGTTGGAGRHVFRTLDTYRELSVSWGTRSLLGAESPGRHTVLALAPAFEPERRSSLGYMMQALMTTLDGRALAGSGGFEPLEPGRWLISEGAVDVESLRRGAALAAGRGEPVLLLATSFALVWLLDRLGGAELPLPEGSSVMFTGGFKGRARSVEHGELGAAICRAFCIRPARLIGEYGMTELSSQLYDTGFDPGGAPSLFFEPPWLRVTPVDPISLAPVPEGEIGLAEFTDLANVDSALKVLTQDRVRREGRGLVLLGRQAGARLRGCSLAVELLAAWQPAGAARGAAR
jgi:hypothetical protein